MQRSLCAFTFASLALTSLSAPAVDGVPADNFEILQPITQTPGALSGETAAGRYYVPATVNTSRWGHLPSRQAEPVLTVPSGATVVIDTISHEGILEDQGRDPVAWFGEHGVAREQVLSDAIALTDSDIKHDFKQDGPHVVTGPVAIADAEPGDVLKVEVLDLAPRVPYGVVSNRHGKGALPGEYPATPAQDGASAEHPERYGNVSIYTPIKETDDGWVGLMPGPNDAPVEFPLNPFMGLMGVAPNTDESPSSVPPLAVGGNADINELGEATTIYYPVKVPGALFYTGDGHFAQGDGEVALTALEGSMRATFRLTLLEAGSPEIPGGQINRMLGETDTHWVTVGLDPSLDEAMKDATRESIRFLHDYYGIDQATALAYLSAATDFEVSQVVDATKGVHGLIRKDDFAALSADG